MRYLRAYDGKMYGVTKQSATIPVHINSEAQLCGSCIRSMLFIVRVIHVDRKQLASTIRKTRVMTLRDRTQCHISIFAHAFDVISVLNCVFNLPPMFVHGYLGHPV